MEEWKEYMLEEICEKITDGSHSSPKAQETGFPMFSVKDMLEYGFDYSNCKYISCEDFAVLKQNDCVPQKGDVLVAKDGSYLKQIFVCEETKDEGVLSSIAIFRPNKLVDPYYLCYLLKSPKIYNYIANNCVSGSALPRIVLKDFKSVKLWIPDIAVQKRIVDSLKPFDDLIKVNKRINDNLEQQAQALFKSWFVDYEPFKDGEFVESELGMIPKGWRVGALGEIFEIKYGKDHKKLSDGIIPVYGSGGLMRYVEKPLYEGESVLIPRKGTLNNVMYVNEAFWTVDTMFYTMPKMQNSMLYAYILLSNKDLASMNSGSAVPSMTTEILNNIQIVMPVSDVLAEFNPLVSAYYAQIKHYDQESRRLAQLRDTLLPRLMSGELNINTVNL